MNNRQIALAARRLALQRRCAEQRSAFAAHAAALAPAAAAVDAVGDGIRYLKRNPEWVIGITALLVAIQPKRVFRWIRRGWTLWRIYDWTRTRLSSLHSRPAST